MTPRGTYVAWQLLMRCHKFAEVRGDEQRESPKCLIWITNGPYLFFSDLLEIDKIQYGMKLIGNAFSKRSVCNELHCWVWFQFYFLLFIYFYYKGH